MPTVLVIGGLVVTAIGVVLILLARFQRPAPSPQEGFDPAAILTQFNELLKLIEAKYRIGIVLIAVGLTLVGIGAWLEAKDAKDAAEEALRAAALLF
jgi:hypothetical protein